MLTDTVYRYCISGNFDRMKDIKNLIHDLNYIYLYLCFKK